MPFGEPCFTADGKKLSVLIKDDVYCPYIYDLERGTFNRVIVDADVESAAISPDGQYLAFSSNIAGPYELWLRRLSDGKEEKLQAGTGIHQCTIRWSPDGRYVVSATMAEGQTTRDVWVVDVQDRSKKPWVFCGGPAEERTPAFSPDGKWLAYCSDESGAREVYIRSFPDPTTRIQVSRGGGDWPRWAPQWSAAGGKLYYRGYRDKDKLYVMDVNPAAGAPVAAATLVYDKRFGQSDYELTDYTVTPDGKLLLVEPSERGPKVSQIHVVLNWPRLLAAGANRQ
jgi:Tol biopolymer transport system component